MQIVSLTAENVKRLTAAHVEPGEGGGLVIIAGENDAGKSSVLDSLWMAMGGGRAIPPRPIHDGADKASIELVLDGKGGDELGAPLKVTRTFTAKSSYLTVENAQGANFRGPQKILDALLGAFTFDPLEFAGMTATAQRETLLSIADLPVDLNALDAREAALVSECQRERAATAQAKGYYNGLPGIVADVPTEAVDVSALMLKAEKMRMFNHEARERVRAVGLADRELQDCKVSVQDAELELQSAQAALDAAQNRHAEAVAAAGSDSTPHDVTAIEDQIIAADKTNRLVAQAAQAMQARQDAKEAYEFFDAELAASEAALKAVRGERAKALREATMPIEGLGVSAEGVTYQNLPLEQASDSGRLKVSIAIAMAMNPTLRVLRVKDGSLLDANNMEMLRSMAEAAEFQIWVERVGTEDAGAVVIADGTVLVESEED